MVLKSKMFELALLVIFMAYGTLSILLGAYSAEDGFINNDSAEYLRLSERLLTGHGFFITTSGRIGQESEILFGVWPIGYTLIATIYYWFISFAASKVLNAILMIVAIFSLYKAFGRRGLIASAILLTAGTLKIYTMTWAEGAFITSLILLIIYIINIANNHTKLNFYGCIWLLVLTILPFLFRYIGLCVLAPVFMSSCYMYYL